MHAAFGIQACLFPVEGSLQTTFLLSLVASGGLIVWPPALYTDQNESQAVLVVIAAIFQSLSWTVPCSQVFLIYLCLEKQKEGAGEDVFFGFRTPIRYHIWA